MVYIVNSVGGEVTFLQLDGCIRTVLVGRNFSSVFNFWLQCFAEYHTVLEKDECELLLDAGEDDVQGLLTGTDALQYPKHTLSNRIDPWSEVKADLYFSLFLIPICQYSLLAFNMKNTFALLSYSLHSFVCMIEYKSCLVTAARVREST